jgi:hypothetical protein
MKANTSTCCIQGTHDHDHHGGKRLCNAVTSKIIKGSSAPNVRRQATTCGYSGYILGVQSNSSESPRVQVPGFQASFPAFHTLHPWYSLMHSKTQRWSHQARLYTAVNLGGQVWECAARLAGAMTTNVLSNCAYALMQSYAPLRIHMLRTKPHHLSDRKCTIM